MAVRDITRAGVESALDEFHLRGLATMLERYGGSASRDWYAEVGNWVYDQKLLLRAAHVLQGLGDLPPRGPGRFNAGQARRRLESLNYRVVGRLEGNTENLATARATEPVMRWLIGAARHRTTLTYGEAASRLRDECGFRQIFPVLMGVAVGQMQYRIRAIDPSAPLLHVLMVRGDTGEPGDGAGEFLVERFPDEELLRASSVCTEHPTLWSHVVGVAAREVYNYSGWEALYRWLFGTFVPDPYYATPPAEGGGVPRGGAGEAENHRNLRLWVMENPAMVDPGFRGATATTEEELLSGDRVDVVYFADEQVLAIEVKSRDSNRADLLRGIYQCIKYGAVLRAQEDGAREVRTLLVTETALPDDLARVANRLDVRHRCIALASK